MKNKLHIFLTIACALLLFSNAYSQLTKYTIQAEYVINIATGITWPDENKITEFKISVLNNDNLYKALVEVCKTKTVKKRPIKIKYIEDLTEIAKPQILITGEGENQDLLSIKDYLKGRPILIITENYFDYKHIMINFTSDEKNFHSFKINSKNLTEVGLMPELKLILYGGTYNDLQLMLNKITKELKETQKEIQLQKNEIQVQNRQIIEQVDLIRQKETEIRLKQQQSVKKQEEIDRKAAEIEKQKKDLRKLNIDVINKEEALQSISQLKQIKEKEVLQQSNKLEKGKEILARLSHEIENHKKEIENQKININKKDNQLEKKEELLSYSFATIILISIVVILILLAFYDKRRSNKKLSILNEEITKQNQEIEQQKEELLITNTEIHRAYENFQILSDFGQKLTATLDIGYVSNMLYNYISSLMDIFAFGVAIYNEKSNDIEFSHFMENGKKIPAFSKSLNNKNSLTVWSFVNQKPILINNMNKEYMEYIDQTPNYSTKDKPNSLIHIPLTIEGRRIGVLIVNSKIKNAYSKNEFNNLQTIAAYLTIALENANSYAKLENALQRLKEAQSQLVQSEKMASLGILSAGIAHEINNPLNFINAGKSAIELYAEESLDQEHIDELTPLVDIIELGVQRASKIVNSLNHFNRQSDSYDEQCSLHKIIDNCITMLQNESKNRIEIVKQYTNTALMLLGNDGELHQLLLNVLTNAIQAIEKEGTITIKTTSNNIAHTIEITDTGCGIAKEHLDKITDPFFTTKPPGKGTGLGMSIAYKILEQHKGKISYTSEVGQGTTVKMLFILK